MVQGVKANISIETLSNLLKEHTMKEIAEILNVSETTIKRYKNNEMEWRKRISIIKECKDC